MCSKVFKLIFSCTLFFNLKFEKRIEFLCPYYAADAVPPYPYHRVNTKDYTECCDDHCCTKV